MAATVKIPSELFALAESSRFQGALELGKLTAGPDEYAFDQPVEWQVDITNTGAALLVSGHVLGSAKVACSRCLEEASHDFAGDVEGYFIIEGADAPSPDGDEADDIGDDEFDVLPADHVIDLEPLIRAALLVDAPTVPLCRDDCAGLCPTCGANLNEGACGCGEDEALAAFDRASNPFAALAEFKFDE